MVMESGITPLEQGAGNCSAGVRLPKIREED